MQKLPADAAERIGEIIAGRDLAQMSLKLVRAELEKRCGLPDGALECWRDEIRQLTSDAIVRSGQHGNGSSSSEAEPSPQEKRKVVADREERCRVGGGRDRAARGGAKLRQSSIMSRKRFSEVAAPISVKIEGKTIKVNPKRFSTGSSGFYSTQKLSMELDGHEVMMQVQLSATVIGSKAWPEE
mmetsp:Transcript_48410/g.139235  ORF Transcript_48410/g.139235 Transcript_48410/m.139235 type:complete len:184 (+) Transcript_48410:60-611(+)